MIFPNIYKSSFLRNHIKSKCVNLYALNSCAYRYTSLINQSNNQLSLNSLINIPNLETPSTKLLKRWYGKIIIKNREKKEFQDRVNCIVQAGSGADGCVSFKREKGAPDGGPDGGDGGKGGNVIIRAYRTLLEFNESKSKRRKSRTSTLSSRYQSKSFRMMNEEFEIGSSFNLAHIQYVQKSEDGTPGGGSNLKGKSGSDIVVPVPCGTVIRDKTTGIEIATLNKPDEEILIAKGGNGGKGNKFFATGDNRAPRVFSKGQKGERKEATLELKLLADVGLVGYPNAGKSTLLGASSSAKPKVAPYPFTTIHPTVGECILEDYSSFTMADIPGLIEGAHVNVGLGHEFLKHIERTKILIYVIDISGLEGIGLIEQADGSFEYRFLTPEEAEQVDIENNTVNVDSTKQLRDYNREAEEFLRENDTITVNTLVSDYLDDEEEEDANDVAQNKPPENKVTSRKAFRRLRRKRRKMQGKPEQDRSLGNLLNNYELMEKYLKDKRSDRDIEEDLDEMYKSEEKQLSKGEYEEKTKKMIRLKKDSMYVVKPYEVLEKLEYELEKYMKGLSKRVKLIVANKIDVPGASQNLEILKQKTDLPIFPVSALNKENIEPVLRYCKKLLTDMNKSNLENLRNKIQSSKQ